MHKTKYTNKENRIAWIKKTLEEIPSGSKILDAGAGERAFKKYCAHLNYISQDFAQYDGRGDGSGKQSGNWDQSGLDIVSDITNIPEPDESFDAIMCIEVFEHLPKPISAICEFSRLLKPGGHLIITAPRYSLTHQSPYHYYCGFNHYFHTTHLEENGFEIIELQKNGNFFEAVAQEIRHIKNRAKKYAYDKPNIIEQVATNLMLKMLNRFSRKDQGSDELFCFGYHVLARKK